MDTEASDQLIQGDSSSAWFKLTRLPHPTEIADHGAGPLRKRSRLNLVNVVLKNRIKGTLRGLRMLSASIRTLGGRFMCLLGLSALPIGERVGSLTNVSAIFRVIHESWP